MLDPARIAELLQPFLGDASISTQLTGQLQTYLDLLLHWNSRMNLTAVRDPEQIVTRHFGESLFAAHVLRDAGAFTPAAGRHPTLADVGSGAGFPGIPIKLFAPEVPVTLIESQNKKATFLREVIRVLPLPDTKVFCGRAETYVQKANIVTLRAVEKFDAVLSTAATLVAEGGILALLIGVTQADSARKGLDLTWQLHEVVRIPLSAGRCILVAQR